MSMKETKLVVPHRTVDTSLSHVMQRVPAIAPAVFVGVAGYVPEEVKEIAQYSPHIGVSIVSNSNISREWLVQLLEPYADLSIVSSYDGRSRIPHIPTAQVLVDTNVQIDTHIDTPLISAHSDHVVLLDSSLNLGESLAWLRYWCTLPEPPYVVVLAMVNEIKVILTYIEAGTGAYTLQGASAAETVETIRGVCQGVAECSPAVTAALFTRLARYAASARAVVFIQPPTLTSVPSITPIPIPVPITGIDPMASSILIPLPLPIPTIVRLTPREIEVLGYIAKDFSNKEIATMLVIQVHTVKHHVHNILEKLELHHRWDAARYAGEQGWLEVTT